MHGEFIKVTAKGNPHPYFGDILGKMLLESGEIGQTDFDAVGEVQARTIVIARTFEQADAGQRQLILDRFGGRDWKTKEPTGKLDLNGAIFGLKIDTAVAELDDFIADLAIDELDTKMKDALNEMRSGKGVHEDAAAIGAITKALLLADYDRNAKQAIVDASLIMQHSTRALGRLERFHTGDYDREGALALMNTCNKLNYKFDPPALIDANEALLSLCAVEMEIDSSLQRGTADMDLLRQMHELSVKNKIGRLLAAIPEAEKMYRAAGKNALADKVGQVHKFYTNRYEGLVDAPHVMLTQEEHMRHVATGAPARKDMN